MKRGKYLPGSNGELSGLRAAAYIRESTVEQGSNSGPEVQRADVEAFAALHGLTMGEVYTDLVSGSSTERRDDFARMLRDAEAGKFAVLLVRDTSRFGRNEYDVMAAERQLHDAGVSIAFTFDNILSSASSGRIELAVKRAIDAEYLRKLSENVRRGYMTKRFSRGHWSGSPPIGYRLGYVERWNPTKQANEPDATGILVPDLVERLGTTGTPYTNAGLVRYIGTLYAKGKLGSRPLAALLNSEGYRTVAGTPFRGGSIQHIVENPAYAGFTSWHQRPDRRLHGEAPTEPVLTHEPLWDDRLWARIQRVRKGAFRGGLGSGQMRHSYAFRRLILCDRCSARMYGESHSHLNKQPVLGYGCKTARERRHDCDQRFVASPAIEAQVGTWLAGVTARDHEADWGRVEDALALAAEDDAPVIRRDTSRIERQLAALKDLYVMGDLDRESYVTRSRTLKALIVDDELPARGTSADTFARAAAHLDDLGRLWLAATDDERGDIASALFKSVRVRDSDIVSVKLADESLLAVIAAHVHATTRARPEGFEPPTY